MSPTKPTLTELAARISTHLRRFEADPEINPGYRWDKLKGKVPDKMGLRDYYHAGAYRGGRYVRVCYIRYQGSSSLTRADAERYLAWLDAGNVGRHFEALRNIAVR